MQRVLPSSQTTAKLGWIVGLILLAFILRIYRLDAVDLRGDEAYSIVHWTATPFTEPWMTLWRLEPAPSGAFIMYWAWGVLVGKTVFAMRCLSVFGNTLGLAVAVALAQRLMKDWPWAILVAALWAINPFLLWHAQDARIYGVQSALTPLTFWLLLRAIDAPTKRGRWLLYCIFEALAVYLYYFEVLWIAAQVIYVLIWRRKQFLQVVFAWIAIGILIIPVIFQAYMLLMVNHYQGTAAYADFLALFYHFAPTLLFGENTTSTVVGIIGSSLLLISLSAARQVQQRGLLIAWITIPVLLLYGLSTRSGYFNPRYVVTVTPALLIALAVIARQFYQNGMRPLVNVKFFVISARIIVIAGLVVLGSISLIEIRDYYFFDPPKAPDWRGLTNYLRDRTTSNDTLISGYPDPAIEYYYPGPGAIYFVPLDTTHDPAADMRRLLSQYDGLFLLTGERAQTEQQYLEQHAQFIPGDTYPGVRQFRPWSVNIREIQNPTSVDFGDSISRLRGYTLLDGTHGGKILLLYWEALAKTSEECSVLIHIVKAENPDGVPDSVLDHGLAQGVISPQVWQPGTVYRDSVTLPTDLPPGDYTVLVGMYETQTVSRLPIADSELEARYKGRFPLLTLRISSP